MEEVLKAIEILKSNLTMSIKIKNTKVMFSRLTFAFFLLLNVSFSFAQIGLAKDSIIEWRSQRLLREDDFKLADSVATTFDALSSIGIDYFSDIVSKGKYRFIVIANFSPNKSWKRSYLTRALLMHEQVHFNIAELFARKIRMQIRGAEIDNQNFDRYVLEIDSIRKEQQEWDRLYDEETSHGRISSEQLKWQKKIDEQLNEWKEYELQDGIELYKYREFIEREPSSDTVIEWQKKKRLKWGDFKRRNPPVGLQASSSVDVIFSCDTLPNGKYGLSIKAYFLPYDSWNKANKNATLLLHEQVHFNIAELIARKMRTCVRGIEVYKHNVDSLVWKILSVKKELDVLHKKHDKETANGRAKPRQLEWQKKIDKQLNELEQYELKDNIELYKLKKKGGK